MLGLATACSHPDAFAYTAPDVGPYGTGSDVLLTFNPMNYWPTATADGSGVIYAFVDESEAAVPPVTQFELAQSHIHRCIGELPVAGGTRHWEYCDNRPVNADSLSSFTAFAMDSAGRLLYAEAVTPRRFPFDTSRSALWLADSATPFRRTFLARLPITLADSTVNWIGGLQWTGPSSFIALGQQMLYAGHGINQSAVDTIFHGQVLIAGVITGAGATLTAIPGTAGASGFAVAENGASVVFTRRDSTMLFKVPVAGGAATTITVTPRPFMQLTGVSCRGATCVVSLGPLTLWRSNTEPAPPTGTGGFELRRVSLPGGDATTILSRSTVLSSPVLTPAGDVIAQVGALYGRFQTFGGFSVGLHLYKGLVQ